MKTDITEIPTGLPLGLTAFLRDLAGITTLVETGTGLGRSATVAGAMFKTVYTIEAHDGRYQKAMRKFEGSNVHPLHGTSPHALIMLIEQLDLPKPTIFFLDAHCFFRPQVNNDPCPLLTEIQTIPAEHIIYIDDEDAFTSVPHPRHLRAAYPELSTVIDALRVNGDPFIFIEGKVIASIPRTLQPAVEDYLHKEKYS